MMLLGQAATRVVGGAAASEDPVRITESLLADAEARLRAGDLTDAATVAVDALEVATETDSLEQGWRAAALAAMVNAELGETAAADDYGEQGNMLLDRLRERWDDDNIDAYFQRADRVTLARGLDR